MKRLTFEDVRSKHPGALEEWVSDVLLNRQQDYADEREVLNHSVFWSQGDVLVLGWRTDGKSSHFLNRWNPTELEWAMDVETLEFMQNHVR